MTTEAHTYTAPAMDWSALDDMPPASDIMLTVGVIFALGVVRVLWTLGWGLPMCWAFWFVQLMIKQGTGYLVVNPLFCLFAPLIAGFIMYVVLSFIGEVLTAPGKIYGEITR